MFFLARFLQSITRFVYLLMGPFRQLGFFAQQARMAMRFRNPFIMLSRALGLYRIRGFFSRITFFFRSPRRFFRFPVPPALKNFLKRFGLFKNDAKGKSGTERPATEGENRDYVYYRPERVNRRWSDKENEAFSQIHLIHQRSQARTVLHIGTSTRSNSVETLLNHPEHPPVRLRFQQVNPDTFNAQIIMTHIAGRTEVLAGGHNVAAGIPLLHNSSFSIAEQSYLCELHGQGEVELPARTRVTAGWFTSVGPRRTNNEDAIGIYQDRDAYLFVVADGVGGGEAGELVSEFATRYLLAAFHKNLHRNVNWLDVLQRTSERINAEVWHFSRRTPTINKAGTTLTAVVIQNWDAHIVHIGDSRLYQWANGVMRQLTTDHTQHITEHNTVEPGAEPDAVRVFLGRAIGRSETIEPELLSIRLQPKDRLLLCTDGITATVKDREIARDITMPPAELATHLVETTNARNTTDNSSAIAIEVLPHSVDWDNWRAKTGERVYTGYSGVGPLYIRREYELPTQYQFLTGLKLTNVIFLIIAVMILLRVLSVISHNDSPTLETATTPTPAPITAVTATPATP